MQLDGVEKALTDVKRTSSQMKDKTKFQEDIARLLRKKAELDQQRRELENRLDEDAVLEPVEERRLAELTEAVDALEMAIEYKSEIIDTKERKLGALIEDEGEEDKRLKMHCCPGAALGEHFAVRKKEDGKFQKK